MNEPKHYFKTMKYTIFTCKRKDNFKTPFLAITLQQRVYYDKFKFHSTFSKTPNSLIMKNSNLQSNP